MKDKPIIVFDFDKTLTNYDTILPFFIFCCKKKKLKFIFVPFFIVLKILSKFKIISVQQEKQIGLKMFCPKKIDEFLELSEEYSKQIKLNKIYSDVFLQYIDKGVMPIIVSASFSSYLEPIFPGTPVIGTNLEVRDTVIFGIKTHAYGNEKNKLLSKIVIEKIDEFYTDSMSDLPLMKISGTTHLVKKGMIT